LHKWDEHWAEHLAATDIFVHLGQPESFGMVILEAFARGCKLIVLPDTFLDDLPPPSGKSGVFRLDELTVDSVVKEMERAMFDPRQASDFWELRSKVSVLFSAEGARTKLARIYSWLLER
jgi:glycosyltransferase involved in cell wall biosynthesis